MRALDTKPEDKAIGFLLPNIGSKRALSDYVATIDSIETITGIDFFYKISNQGKFEKDVNLEDCF